MMVETQLYISSAFGPAEQLHGGSRVISASSFWILNSTTQHPTPHTRNHARRTRSRISAYIRRNSVDVKRTNTYFPTEPGKSTRVTHRRHHGPHSASTVSIECAEEGRVIAVVKAGPKTRTQACNERGGGWYENRWIRRLSFLETDTPSLPPPPSLTRSLTRHRGQQVGTGSNCGCGSIAGGRPYRFALADSADAFHCSGLLMVQNYLSLLVSDREREVARGGMLSVGEPWWAVRVGMRVGVGVVKGGIRNADAISPMVCLVRPVLTRTDTITSLAHSHTRKIMQRTIDQIHIVNMTHKSVTPPPRALL
jgi:hypothetical protein